MPDGSEFNGPVELKDYLLAEKQDPFIRNVVERMLAYALGRDLKHYDEMAILKIIAALEKDLKKFNFQLVPAGQVLNVIH